MVTRALFMVTVGLLATGCEREDEAYLLNYQSQQTLLCVSEVSTDQGQRGLHPHCRFAPALEPATCPAPGVSLRLPTADRWTVQGLRYTAWLTSWETCWAEVEACVARRDCPEAWKVGSVERRIGWDGGVSL